jgi:hypothetical protein
MASERQIPAAQTSTRENLEKHRSRIDRIAAHEVGAREFTIPASPALVSSSTGKLRREVVAVRRLLVPDCRHIY